ncbi:ParA family protein [Agrobacterium tumefaciens]|uniref:ParA family protein n=1 Tax=Agrobacterium tumefaciens TaxID=358 RepID=UPI001F358291|nr:ParA family protein [Agrobacterium tumefaciens]
MPTGLTKIIENHERSIAENVEKVGNFKYQRYCVSNLRGGIGKSTLSFNITYLLSRFKSTLAVDLCPQKNFTEVIMRDEDYSVAIGNALRPVVLGPAFGDIPVDISYLISKINDSFKGGKASYFIPGDSSLFSFPSSLYQQLQQAMAANNERAARNILLSLEKILKEEMKIKDCELALMDCSPFYAGATHLAWCASDAIIIPVRVDEHSIDSLKLTLDMLSSPTSDFNIWADRAGGLPAPKVASIVMTMVGARSNKAGVKDMASQMYIERAYAVASEYPHLFDFDDPADAFAITDDFMSAGRISGALSIPIPQLKVGAFHSVDDGKRLQVNQSKTNYERELDYLISLL